MKESHKIQIAQEIERLCKVSEQKMLAKRAGISPTTMSQIRNGNWKLISDKMWRKIRVKLRMDLGWHVAETKLFKDLWVLLSEAQRNHATVSFSHRSGTGKTTLYLYYQRSNPNVIYLEGKKVLNAKAFLTCLLANAGQDAQGTILEMYNQFIDHVSGLERPLIILDQFDKLVDTTFDMFMDFYNDLYAHCGFVTSGVSALEKRAKSGVQSSRIGYGETWSRMDSNFIKLDPISLDDVTSICKANGIDDPEVIHESYNGCEGDLRRVRKDVLKYHLKHSKIA